jgi:glycosyltransferase involved in cell wall biosynthesis
MNRLHIISFNIPYPPDYGGVIDVYYKLRALHDAGIKIILHCFEYGRKEQIELNEICEAVYYYHRDFSIRDFSSLTPFIVKSRKSSALLKNLAKDSAPILFEGLHTCYYLSHPALQSRFKIVRMHNVEADYYKALGRNERNIMSKFYFYTESIKLNYYERILKYADLILPISVHDDELLKLRYQHVYYLPAFHPNFDVQSLTGKGDYVLFHGNLSVNENNQAAVWLTARVFATLNRPVIIAGSEPKSSLRNIVAPYKHIQLIANPSQKHMAELIRNAHIHVLPSFQSTGIKLKLLNALFNGRFVIVNDTMVEHTGLETLCSVCNTAEDIQLTINKLMDISFSSADIETRRTQLGRDFTNAANAKKLIQLLEQSL